ncbi:hypothetical protein [Prosthecobacter sp.]|uniref:hypothetical protein n=1 Tax=Prosthecobacter sp. TaxID=1965333 RepID=UPI003783E79E
MSQHLEGEEEDEEVMQQPPPRAGMVRAFSHPPVRDNPAPSTSTLQADSPRGGIVPVPPGSATPSTSRSPMSEAQDYAPPPEADSDHAPEDDTATQDHADDRPWYMPRITAQGLPPQDHPENAHALAPKPWENTTRSSGFDDAPPEDRSTSSTHSSGFSPSPQDLRDSFHSPSPDSPTREAPTLPQGRIFEKRLPPGFRAQGTGQLPVLADKPEYHDLVYRPGSAENGQHQAGGFFQNVADTRTTREAPSSPKATQTFAQIVRPAPPSVTGNTKDTRDPLTILSEKFADFPKVVESLQGLNRLPTGRLMIAKLASVADKIHIGLALSGKSYIDHNGVFRVRRDIDPATLGHEFQHLGEMLFGTEDPFIKVSHPSDATAYPETGNMGKEFRAMRIQNQLLLERARMMRIFPLLNQHYYFDDKTKYRIPGGPLPPPLPVVPIPFL